MSSETASATVGYATATQALRTATRWLLTAAAGAGGALVAGLQLTNIGALGTDDWPRLVAALGGLATVLAAVGYMVARTSRLLTDEWITLAQLDLERFTHRLRDSGRRSDKRRGEALDRIYEEIQSYQDELYADVADSVPDLYARLKKANEAARRRALPAQARKSVALRNAVDAVVQYANYSYTRDSFVTLRVQLAKAATAAAAGVLVFAYAANPPKAAAPTTTISRAARAAQLAGHTAAAAPTPPARGTWGLRSESQRGLRLDQQRPSAVYP